MVIRRRHLNFLTFIIVCLYTSGEEFIVLRLMFGRSLLGSLLTDCLPTIIVNLIGHLTNYFEMFELAVGVNLTNLLVISTM